MFSEPYVNCNEKHVTHDLKKKVTFHPLKKSYPLPVLSMDTDVPRLFIWSFSPTQNGDVQTLFVNDLVYLVLVGSYCNVLVMKKRYIQCLTKSI